MFSPKLGQIQFATCHNTLSRDLTRIFDLLISNPDLEGLLAANSSLDAGGLQLVRLLHGQDLFGIILPGADGLISSSKECQKLDKDEGHRSVENR